MIESLRNSTESKNLIDAAKTYLYGVKGSIVQDKKRKAEKQAARLAVVNGQQPDMSSGMAAAPARHDTHGLDRQSEPGISGPQAGVTRTQNGTPHLHTFQQQDSQQSRYFQHPGGVARLDQSSLNSARQTLSNIGAHSSSPSTLQTTVANMSHRFSPAAQVQRMHQQITGRASNAGANRSNEVMRKD